MVCNNPLKYGLALCLMLIIGLVLLSWSHAIYVDVGFDPDRVVELLIVRVLDCLGGVLILCSILGYVVKPLIFRSGRMRMKDRFKRDGARALEHCILKSATRKD